MSPIFCGVVNVCLRLLGLYLAVQAHPILAFTVLSIQAVYEPIVNNPNP
jgi:hypothetical protein